MVRATSQHPRAGAASPVRTALFLLFTGLLATAGPLVSAARAQSEVAPLTRYQLLPEYTVRLDEDGTCLVWRQHDAEPLLTVKVAGLLDGPRGKRRGLEDSGLTALLHERSPGGARGFSSDADDDQDGAVDEDRLDGLDNDGDGLVDEDFAAVSDHMAVVQRRLGGRFVHQESYHWPLPGLRSTFFLKLDTDVPDGATLELDGPAGHWLATNLATYEHLATGKAMSENLQPFVMRVPVAGEGQDSGWLWLGVLVLDGPDGWRAREDGTEGRLQLPLAGQPLVVAVALAPSWTRLSVELGMARRVYEGVADPVSGHRARWIVPATCSLCRTVAAPAASLKSTPDGDLLVTLAMTEGGAALVDCDLFSLAGKPLGPPSRLVWRPENQAAVKLDWQEVTPRTLQKHGGFAGHPFVRTGTDEAALSRHTGPGQLELTFPGAELSPGARPDARPEQLNGYWLDGRAFSARVQAPGKPAFTAVPTAQESQAAGGEGGSDPGTTSRSLRQAEHPPTLAPELLEGWPNPFQDVIQVRFKVPSTVGEAFVWVEEEDAPASLDKDAAVPWQGSGAVCSVKIYNINGQELVTLYEGSGISGEVTVSWNGTDSFGRQVASGTYFCKLQLDDWSVTRRVVYLR